MIVRIGVLLLLLGLLAAGNGQSLAQDESEPQASATETPSPGLPTASITPDPSWGVAPLMVGFFLHFDDPMQMEPISYHWTFGDGQVATTPWILTYHTFQNPGTYMVTLTVATADGRSATTMAPVIVVSAAQ